MSTPGIPVESDFRAKTKTNDVPVARLIGFEAKETAEGRAMAPSDTTKCRHRVAVRGN